MRSRRTTPVALMLATIAAAPAARAADAEVDAVRPFVIEVPEAALDDLRARLAASRLPDQLAGVSWEYGADRAWIEELLAYWRDEFDWRRQEAMLNRFDQFVAAVDGLELHFIHQRSENPEAMPLLIVHGWPGSVGEFHKIIGPLTDPAARGGRADDAFHVVAPSLPGFGFSGIPAEPGWHPERIALVLAGLMERLGYERYGLAGGDWGAIINRHIANHYPERLTGMHSNMLLAREPDDPAARAQVTEEEAALRAARIEYMRGETGYQRIQGTKPQTLAYALNDSPAGLAAWIVEKFHGWTDMPQGAGGDLDDHFSKDELLTNVSIYWFTRTIASSMRIYYESARARPIKPMGYIDVPTGAAVFPAELYITPRAWAEAAYDIRHWTVMPRGGHFAALESPGPYVEDLRTFFRLAPVRARRPTTGSDSP